VASLPIEGDAEGRFGDPDCRCVAIEFENGLITLRLDHHRSRHSVRGPRGWSDHEPA